jgi:hypothetical protein
MKGRGATMPFLTELGEVLHEEHFRILSLICGLENRVIERRRPIDPRYEDEKEHLQGAHRLRWNSSEARDGSPSCVIRLSDPAVDPRLKRAGRSTAHFFRRQASPPSTSGRIGRKHLLIGAAFDDRMLLRELSG